MSPRIQNILPPVLIAIALTFLFWWPLYFGAGLVGGDLYPYFFPQKAFYADHLKAGEFPLWNDLTGFGYPVIGESQTGAAYPFHFLFYYCFDLNTAYNIEHLLHYIICFVATFLFAKRVGLNVSGAYLVAVVFTYGWFPPRACLEWAVLTGAWLPAALWCVESFLQTRWWRYAIGLSVVLGLQLLGGHFHLAFITQLLVATYASWRLWIEQCQRKTENRSANEFNNKRAVGKTVKASTAQRSAEVQMLETTCSRNPCGKRAAAALILAGMAGMGLAAIQLLPTWELKQRSSRVVSGGDYDPAYGHMPPLYATQMIVPWFWYSLQNIDEDNLVREMAELVAPWHWFGPGRSPSPDGKPLLYNLDEAIHRHRFGALSTGTNKVEAHVYCGMISILMALVATITWCRQPWTGPQRNRTESIVQATTGYWIIAGLLAIIYATGILLPIGMRLPGFSFFRAPGRYGIVTTLTIALLAGQCLDRLLLRINSQSLRGIILTAIFASTCGDLWLVSRMVKYTYLVTPPISFRNDSEVRRLLLAEPTMPRMLAPGPNVGTLLGVSCVPWYLGIAPAEYVDSRFAMPPIPKPLANGKPTPGSSELCEWLSRSGVTHCLNFEPLDESSWHVELLWKGVDPFLNRVWGRGRDPIYLYRFRTNSIEGDATSFPGRAYLADGNETIPVKNEKDSATGMRRVAVDEKSKKPELLILTELAYPGWVVESDGKPIASKQVGMFRGVELADSKGEVVWKYRPASVFYGAIISLVTLFVLAAIAHVKFWHPKLVSRLLRTSPSS